MVTMGTSLPKVVMVTLIAILTTVVPRFTGWSLVQRSPTECGVCKKCVIVKPRKMRRSWPPRGYRDIVKKSTSLYGASLFGACLALTAVTSTSSEPQANRASQPVSFCYRALSLFAVLVPLVSHCRIGTTCVSLSYCGNFYFLNCVIFVLLLTLLIRRGPKCSASDKRSRKALTLKQKLEMIQLSEKVMSNAEIGRKLGLARQTAQLWLQREAFKRN